MKLFTFIPIDRTLAEESVQVPAMNMTEAVKLLWPENPDDDKEFYFVRKEWGVFSTDMEEV